MTHKQAATTVVFAMLGTGVGLMMIAMPADWIPLLIWLFGVLFATLLGFGYLVAHVSGWIPTSVSGRKLTSAWFLLAISWPTSLAAFMATSMLLDRFSSTHPIGPLQFSMAFACGVLVLGLFVRRCIALLTGIRRVSYMLLAIGAGLIATSVGQVLHSMPGIRSDWSVVAILLIGGSLLGAVLGRALGETPAGTPSIPIV